MQTSSSSSEAAITATKTDNQAEATAQGSSKSSSSSLLLSPKAEGGSNESNNNNSSSFDLSPQLPPAQKAADPLVAASSTSASGTSRMAAGSGSMSLRSGRSSLSSQGSGSGSGDGAETKQLSSNAEYDHIRNTTLMFFLDRLYIASKEGKEARTLHDLSCLFGTRDFTKEMRQIVGASRNGLKKFLQSYPSLFTIDGDRVLLTQLKQDSASSSARDYNKEAVDYFRQKLLQFGSSLVPIRNLFGYRSQASQEVRHVSGKNTKEFKQFLGAHADVFEILADEHVVLKSALHELESRGELAPYSLLTQESSTGSQSLGPADQLQQPQSLQQPSNQHPNLEDQVLDPYLNKQFAHSIQGCMQKMAQEADSKQPEAASDQFKVTLEFLHQKILTDCQNQLFLKMVKTIEDFRVFLRMHPKIFKRSVDDSSGKEFVSLVSEEERREMDLQSYPSLAARQHSKLRRVETNESQLSGSDQSVGGQPFSLPPQMNSSGSNEPVAVSQATGGEQPMSLIMATGSHRSTPIRKTSTPNATSHKQSNQQQQSANNNNSASGLRATAPPFVPSFASARGQPKSLTSGQQQPQPIHRSSQQAAGFSSRPIQRSVSNLGSSPAAARGVIDPRQALRSYLMKASAVNSSSGLYSPNKLSNGAYHYQQQQPPQPGGYLSRQSSNLGPNSLPPKHQLNFSNNNNNSININNHQQQQAAADDLRTRTVNIVREASNIVTRIMNSTDSVAFDCKGYNLGFDGQITLIQFAFLPNANKSTATNNQKENKQQKPEVCIFDLITNPELAYCLKPLLESEQIVKIVHDVRNKSNALHSQFGIMLTNVFDTQVANLVIQQQETGKPAYKSRYISMSKLCEIYGDESLTKYRNLIKSKTRHSTSGQQVNSTSSSSKAKDVNYWRTRPLTDAMVYESTMDVYCLVGGVYQNLKSKIIPEYKPLFEQLNLEGVLARIKPDEIRSVKKERKIDLEVIDLKRKLYSDTTSSIVLSNREIRLLRHIDLSEEVRQKIQQCKKVAKKLERLDLKAAQNAQLLQSMNTTTSQPSSGDVDFHSRNSANHNQADHQSMDPNSSVHTVGSSLSSNSSASLHGRQTEASNEELAAKLGITCEVATNNATSGGENNNLLDGTEMNDLMDSSSMFDELKDKMIESSSLLESLANEDDDDRAQLSSHHSGSHHSGDSCRCLCHHGKHSLGSNHSETQQQQPPPTTSDATTTTTTSTDNNDKDPAADKTTDLSSTPSVNVPPSASSTDNDDASVESKAVDMAIQCDLLS